MPNAFIKPNLSLPNQTGANLSLPNRGSCPPAPAGEVVKVLPPPATPLWVV